MTRPGTPRPRTRLPDGVRGRHRAPPPRRNSLSPAPATACSAGESLPAAAARELAEETGLRVTPGALGQLVAHTSGYAELTWASGVFAAARGPARRPDAGRARATALAPLRTAVPGQPAKRSSCLKRARSRRPGPGTSCR
ncbi:NUDIX domain-containing protein [Streptomyces sp. NPDC007100]|uniref:NUDIX domain-containing protein n=1 Tax=Streptomyces sp. NPDC007100 TaxID=3155602 RepID=UPI00340D261B